jgi:hypothetical protein
VTAPTLPPSPVADAAEVRAWTRDLDHALAGLHARIRRRFLLLGGARLAGVLAIAALLYYLADRSLELPAAARVVVTAGLACWLLLGLRRHVVYPLRKPFSRDDVAIVVERRFPQLREKLITAWQLKDALRQDGQGLRNQSPELIASTVAAAAADVRSLPLGGVLDQRHAAQVAGLAAGLVLLLLGGFATNPAAAGVFLWRALGLEVAYPRLTTLVLELPDSGPDHRVEVAGRTATVTLAAGADLPVAVRCLGAVPRAVFLAVSGGRGLANQVAMSARAQDLYRHTFRRVHDGFTFHARGGDDPYGDKTVTVRVVHPPLVGTIRALLTYPEYTGVAPAEQSGGGIEALEGTRVLLQVRPTAPVASAELAFVESGQRVPLVPQVVQDDQGTVTIHAGEFVVTNSDRYEVVLASPDGLRNPHPGQYPVVALADVAPAGRLLSPPEDSLDVVLPNGLLFLRVEGRDDHRIERIEAHVQLSKRDASARLDLTPRADRQARQVVACAALEVRDLPAAGSNPPVGESLSVRVELVDNRRPEAHRTTLHPRAVHVIGESDLARRIAGHFRRLREEVEKAIALQQDRFDRTAELVAQLEQGDAPVAFQSELTLVEVGQGRLQGNAERIHQDLMRAFDVHLLNRLESPEATAPVLELFLRVHQGSTAAAAHLPEFYRRLAAERRAGRIGTLDKALDPILAMVGTADAIGGELAPKTHKLLAQAGVAAAAGERADLLRSARTQQAAILQELETLRSKLDEWNEFQDVVQQTRGVLDRQRDVQTRTRIQLGGNK